MLQPFRYELIANDGRARRGRIHTPHGALETPAFMPVGTRAAVKGISPIQFAATGSQIVLANTYHLLIRPGPETVARLGGLHRMMNWPGPILTDSGGFQVFSLAELRRLDDDGVKFKSHVDGAEIVLTPETSIHTQNQLGADIIMCFDECPPLGVSDKVAMMQSGNVESADLTGEIPLATLQNFNLATASVVDAVRRTVAWAKRCKAAHRRAKESEHGPPQALYGIVQGGLDVALRRQCLDQLVEIGFDGYALGGLSVGEAPPKMWEFMAAFADTLPADRPRYVMGIGTPRDLVEAVAAGVDQFDCVLPTRNGRKGYAFTSQGTVRLRNSRHRESQDPLDPACACECCRGFSRGYLRHLLANDEALGATLVSIHNLHFYQDLVRGMRTAIASGGFANWRSTFLASPVCAAQDNDASKEPE